MGRAVSFSRRIAFVNEKGGSAKTTLVANLAAYFALRRGRRVLAIDLRPAGPARQGARRRRARRAALGARSRRLGAARPVVPRRRARGRPGDDLPLRATRIPGLDLVVANKSLALHASFESRRRRPDRSPAPAPRALAPRIRAYDFVLMDSPPSFSPLTLNVLRAADELVMPVPLTYLALDGCAELLRTAAHGAQRASAIGSCACRWWCPPSTAARASPTRSSNA